jgi:hypothetical protein
MPRSHAIAAAVVLGLCVAAPPKARAHDLTVQLNELEKATGRIGQTLSKLKSTPAAPKAPESAEEHRRVLGAAEIELMLGHRKRGLEMLLGRLEDPAFQTLPEYVDTLLLASQVLEQTGEAAGSMSFARQALEHGGVPTQMAEAGARWFRVARLNEVLVDRPEIYALWQKQGGLPRAPGEEAAQAAYEAAWALRADHRYDEGLALLSKVPSESAVGSRAAYLSGVLFVEKGDLVNAERWFSAVMGWALPPKADDPEQKAIESEVRELAALSAARLRYERGDLDGADEAYALIANGSPLQADVCYERAYLSLERKQKRGALTDVQCLMDLGAGGERYIDARLMHASILAHLERYSESVEDYTVMAATIRKERDIVKAAVDAIQEPASFLFDGMERNAITQGDRATPGPATIFGDAWTPAVDRAYRLDRDLGQARTELGGLIAEIDWLRRQLDGEDAFFSLRLRGESYRRLLRDIKHLSGHATDLAIKLPHRHAAAELDPPVPDDSHAEEQVRAANVMAQLDDYAKEVEGQLAALAKEETERRAEADRVMRAIEAEAGELTQVAKAIAADASLPIDDIARSALRSVVSRFENAVMRAEAGVLDTYWVRKEHVSDRIRELGFEKEAVKHEYRDAFGEFFKDGP